jgi:hypothetical protein
LFAAAVVGQLLWLAVVALLAFPVGALLADLRRTNRFYELDDDGALGRSSIFDRK